MTSMKCTLHDWNRKKSHGAKSNEYGIWYVGNDFMPALLEKDNRAMSPGFVDTASYITDPVSYTFLFYTSPYFTCTRWIYQPIFYMYTLVNQQYASKMTYKTSV